MNRFGDLLVTGVLLHKSQTCLWREERTQSLVLVSLKDEKTNETGHLIYGMEVDKRDIMEEKIYTDNPRLFADNHPESYELQNLLGMVDDNTPTEETEETDAALSACWGGSLLECGKEEHDSCLYVVE